MNGVYIHIPFCKSKCPYCDFYSYGCSRDDKASYIEALIDEINTLERSRKFLSQSFTTADTLYIGGGTPSLLTGDEIERIVTAAKEKFHIPPEGEITIECNPGSNMEELIPHFKKCGINRVSLGMQSAVDKERKKLGRSADKKRIKQVITLLKESGINNISLDIMLGIPSQTRESLMQTLDFVAECDIPHVSAYILKIEDNTYFGKNRDKLTLPDDDEVSDFYEICCCYLEKKGIHQYEVSNFAKKGYESRHNTKYWLLDDYLGIGPSAHSFVGGKRFYFTSETQDFIDGQAPVFDDYGGSYDEYIMLGLRLSKGIDMEFLASRYGEKTTKKINEKAPLLCEKGLVNYDGRTLSLTVKGFLISNTVINEFI